MRLLNVHQLKLEQFFDERIRPDYAILSHTWGDEEVSLQHLPLPAARSMVGFSKITQCCELAIKDGFEYVWIDTCCIDKTSSAELSEAINSMYNWYKSATVCYAYLSDVKTADDPTDPESPFSKSRWFTRGWTLQELLAPKAVFFYDSSWAEIGTRTTLQEDLSRITGIPCEALSSESTGQISNEFCIAQRMSWAAMRETTRVEDRAYCLMGVFGVNMPTLYGEGEQAFIRLQLEIMKTSDDHSLFSWSTPDYRKAWAPNEWWDADDDSLLDRMRDQRKEGPESGMLASSPTQFQYAQGVRRRNSEVATSKPPYSMTNTGLHIWLPNVQVRTSELEVYQAILNCEIIDGIGPLSIYLRRHRSGQYSRVFTSIVRTANNVKYDPELVELYVTDPPSTKDEITIFEIPPKSRYIFHLLDNPSVEEGYTFLDCEPDCWDQETHTFEMVIPSHPSIAMTYFIVGANHDPTAHAFVMLAGEANPGRTTSKFRCNIWPLSEINGWELVSNLSNALYSLYSEMKGSFNPERISKELPNGHTLSIAFRPSPQPREKGPRSSRFYGTTQEYRLVITFTPSKFPFPNPVYPRPVDPHPLPKLNVNVHVRHNDFSFQPKQCWSVEKRKGQGESLILNWTPTGRHKSALLALFNEERLAYPLFMVRVVDSDIALELINVSSNYGPPSTWDSVLSSYLDETHPIELESRKQYRIPSDFPVMFEVDGEPIRIELRRRTLLSDVGHQMLLTSRYEVI